jgi:hypothetical protein
MAETEPLFSTDLISPEVLAALPEGYSCRPLQQADYHKGFLDVLRVLTTVGDITEEVMHSPSPSHLPLLSFPILPFNPSYSLLVRSLV